MKELTSSQVAQVSGGRVSDELLLGMEITSSVMTVGAVASGLGLALTLSPDAFISTMVFSSCAVASNIATCILYDQYQQEHGYSRNIFDY
jgi:hypothetical protein